MLDHSILAMTLLLTKSKEIMGETKEIFKKSFSCSTTKPGRWKVEKIK
jgi:hypothetical protein